MIVFTGRRSDFAEGDALAKCLPMQPMTVSDEGVSPLFFFWFSAVFVFSFEFSRGFSWAEMMGGIGGLLAFGRFVALIRAHLR